MTYNEFSARQLYALCQAVGVGGSAHDYLAVQAMLLAPWGERDVPALAPYPSRIGDDHSPYEYSVQFAKNSVELRLLFEAQAQAPSLHANQAAAVALNQKLAQRYGVDLSRFVQLQDLFCPEDPQGPFSLWHAACFDRAGQPDFKIYLNPRVHCGTSGQQLTTEGVARLGLSRAADSVIRRVVDQGGEPNYFSLDLGARLGSRVKLYFSHEDATLQTLEQILALSPSNQVGDVTRFCRGLLDEGTKLSKKPVCYCFSFVSGMDSPLAVTLHLPVAHYCRSDAEIMSRASKLMASEGLPVEAYQRAVMAMARRDLQRVSGVQSYFSFRREASGLKTTVYLSPELFAAPEAQFPFGDNPQQSSSYAR
ncbi:MAG TPA: tryptophan dimethylallyltransferase family protein [Polyangiaceae bacterium]|nr:tryptophan dimethylallyltransferase family protein [Polyangiaceae bacterium]